MTTVEKKFIQQLKEVEETLKVYKRAMEQVKIKESYHKNQVYYKKTETVFPQIINFYKILIIDYMLLIYLLQ